MKTHYTWDDKKQTWVESKGPRGLKRIMYAGVGGTAGWPIKSDAAGVHPSQIGEARDELARHGCMADFTQDGRIVFEDAAHRKKCLRAIGMFDKNSFC